MKCRNIKIWISEIRFLNFVFLKVGIETSVWGVGARLPPPAIPALSGERSPDPQILTFEIKNSNLSFPKICKLCDRWSQHESFSCPTTAQAGSGRTSPITTWGQKSVWRSIFENDFPLKLMFFFVQWGWILKINGSIASPKHKTDPKSLSRNTRPFQNFFPFVKRLSERGSSLHTTCRCFRLFCYTKSKDFDYICV